MRQPQPARTIPFAPTAYGEREEADRATAAPTAVPRDASPPTADRATKATAAPAAPDKRDAALASSRAAATPVARPPAKAASPSVPVGTRFGGAPQVLDGATLSFQGTAVRLHGVVAPALGQACYHAHTTWDCGAAAKAALERIVARGPIGCTVTGADGAVPTADCTVIRDDVARALVATGLAKTRAPALQDVQAHARAERRGLWVADGR